MSCETPDLTALKTKLAEAETAYHRLLIGAGKASISFGPSKSVTYTQASIPKLRAYINDLNDQIGVIEGCAKKLRRTVRMRF
jgi:hypothetical protein